MAKSTTKNIKDKSKMSKTKKTTSKVSTKVTEETKSAKGSAKSKPLTLRSKKTSVTKSATAARKKSVAPKTADSKSGEKTVQKSKVSKAKAKTAVRTPLKYNAPLSVKDALKKIKGYGKRDLSKFKKVIIEKRADIIKQLQALKDQMMDSTTGQYVNENSPYSLHMAEQGTDAQEREKLYLWAQRENKFLSYLDDALQRIENGTYGICIDSINVPKQLPHLIPMNRLFAVPHTQHCVDCKMKKDKNKRR